MPPRTRFLPDRPWLPSEPSTPSTALCLFFRLLFPVAPQEGTGFEAQDGAPTSRWKTSLLVGELGSRPAHVRMSCSAWF